MSEEFDPKAIAKHWVKMLGQKSFKNASATEQDMVVIAQAYLKLRRILDKKRK